MTTTTSHATPNLGCWPLVEPASGELQQPGDEGPILVWMMWMAPQLGMLTFFVTATVAGLYLRSRSASVG